MDRSFHAVILLNVEPSADDIQCSQVDVDSLSGVHRLRVPFRIVRAWPKFFTLKLHTGIVVEYSHEQI